MLTKSQIEAMEQARRHLANVYKSKTYIEAMEHWYEASRKLGYAGFSYSEALYDALVFASQLEI